MSSGARAVEAWEEFVGGPVSDEQVAFALGVFAEQEALFGEDPQEGDAEYWLLLAEAEETLALERQEPAGWAGEELDRGLQAAVRGLDRAAGLGGAGRGGAEGGVVDPAGLVHVFDAGVVDALGVAGALRTVLDGLTFALVAEAR
ncbi:hypothetical protein, partial [Ornithinimicrobium tianjinense]|uniref:hypothetical protein n=1 Tax=Ornithinimicrobium tianjinense TaxID=1195761 RepID=UPI001662BDA5